MKKIIKVWDYCDFKGTEKDHPVTWADLNSKRGCEATIMTLKEAREDNKKAIPSVYKDEDGFWEMVIKADRLKEKDLQEYMDALTLFSGVKYQVVRSPIHKKIKNKMHFEYGCTPCVHYDEIRRWRGKAHYKAEITDSAGTHGIWLDKKKVDDGLILIRNPKPKRSKVRK
ncbi:MAG: hypothetical protein NT001_01065 [Candidatus Woesearchaeota archaeon]|nr:hypothetical protein [Candidatus Woesearchaeota archaeon]